LIKNYLEFRYIGGKDYQKKPTEIIELMEYMITVLYKSWFNVEYSDKNKTELISIFKKYQKPIDAYNSYENFIKLYPNIELTVDLNKDKKVVKIYFDTIKDKLFNLLTDASLKKGLINYDSDKGRLQLKNVKMFPCYNIEDVDLIKCNINGNVTDCNIFSCDIKFSTLKNCNIYSDSILHECKINNSYIGQKCIVTKGYIYGNNSIMTGTMKSGIFRSGQISKNATISDNVEVIEYKNI